MVGRHPVLSTIFVEWNWSLMDGSRGQASHYNSSRWRRGGEGPCVLITMASNGHTFPIPQFQYTLSQNHCILVCWIKFRVGAGWFSLSAIKRAHKKDMDARKTNPNFETGSIGQAVFNV
jgi:hypothetical protein